MSANQPIIDIEPVSYSGYRSAGRPASENRVYGTPVYVYRSTWSSGASNRFAAEEASFPQRARSPFRALAGMAQMAVGTGLVALGIPMLLLPGPGLLTIALGGLVAASGALKVFAW